jgi:hypothetical protein
MIGDIGDLDISAAFALVALVREFVDLADVEATLGIGFGLALPFRVGGLSAVCLIDNSGALFDLRWPDCCAECFPEDERCVFCVLE